MKTCEWLELSEFWSLGEVHVELVFWGEEIWDGGLGIIIPHVAEWGLAIPDVLGY